MNSREWDPSRTIGSDIFQLTESIKKLKEADLALVRSEYWAELRTAFIDLARLIGSIVGETDARKLTSCSPTVLSTSDDNPGA